MTTAATIMLVATWAVVFTVTGRFFYKVLTTPTRPDEQDDEGGADDR